MSKAREWLVMPGWTKINIDNPDGKIFKIREVLDGHITISREELRNALLNASGWPDTIDENQVELILFGPKPKP
jgi:hypothetical protein